MHKQLGGTTKTYLKRKDENAQQVWPMVIDHNLNIFFSRLAAVKEIQITHSSPTQNPVVKYGCVFAFLKFCFCFCFNMTTVWSLTRWSGQVAPFRLNTWASSTLHCALGIRPCSHTVQTTSTVHSTKPCHLKLCWQQKSLHSSSMQNTAVHFTVLQMV